MRKEPINFFETRTFYGIFSIFLTNTRLTATSRIRCGHCELRLFVAKRYCSITEEPLIAAAIAGRTVHVSAARKRLHLFRAFLYTLSSTYNICRYMSSSVLVYYQDGLDLFYPSSLRGSFGQA